MAFGKSAARGEDVAVREQRERAAAAERAAREHATSPVGRAELALARGDRFFQLPLPVLSLAGDPSWFGSSDNQATPAGSRRTDGKPDVLTQIEDLGWQLEHVGYVFLQTGATSSGRIIGGEGIVTEGSVIGIYLFRAAG